MRNFLIQDIDISTVFEKEYDLCFFACGYEKRSTYLINKLNYNNLNNVYVIEYTGGDPKQIKNKDKFIFIPTKEHDELKIYSILNEYIIGGKSDYLKILIEYSSLSRLWYSAIINWARFVDIKKVDIDFVYCIGKYQDEFKPLQIDGLYSILGYEGKNEHPKTLAAFGLGFDKMAALCVIDKIEPDLVLSFVASTNINSYEKKATDINKEFIETYCHHDLLYFPIASVTNTYRMMSEMITLYINEYNLLFIPMGPKPHFLASLLLATKYPEITNLYVKGYRKYPPNVLPTNHFICTNITFYHE